MQPVSRSLFILKTKILYLLNNNISCPLASPFYFPSLWIWLFFVVVVESLSCVQLFATPWIAAHQATLSFTITQSLLKLMSIESVISSNHFIPCCPLLFLPSVFSSIRVFSNESVLHNRWPKYWSFSYFLYWKDSIVDVIYCMQRNDSVILKWGLPGGVHVKEPICLWCRRHQRCRFNTRIGKIPWRRAWQPALAFLPRESHGQRNLASYSP